MTLRVESPFADDVPVHTNEKELRAAVRDLAILLKGAQAATLFRRYTFTRNSFGQICISCRSAKKIGLATFAQVASYGQELNAMLLKRDADAHAVFASIPMHA